MGKRPVNRWEALSCLVLQRDWEEPAEPRLPRTIVSSFTTVNTRRSAVPQAATSQNRRHYWLRRRQVRSRRSGRAALMQAQRSREVLSENRNQLVPKSLFVRGYHMESRQWTGATIATARLHQRKPTRLRSTATRTRSRSRWVLLFLLTPLNLTLISILKN